MNFTGYSKLVGGSIRMAVCLFDLSLFYYDFLSAGSVPGIPERITISELETGVTVIPNPPGYATYAVRTVADVDRDGIDDIVITGTEQSGASDEILIDEISILFGNPRIREGLTAVEPVTIRWEGESSVLFPGHVAAGDIRGDYVVDLIVPGATIESGTSGFFVIPMNTDILKSGSISEDTPGIIYLYAKDGNNADHQEPLFVRRGFFAADMNGDGMDDVVFSAPKKYRMAHIYVGEAYVVFGERQMPPVINVFETETPFSRILGDTLFYNGFANMVAGDVDGDLRQDLIIDGGSLWPTRDRVTGLMNYPECFSRTFIFAGTVLNSPAYKQTGVIDMLDHIPGLAGQTRNIGFERLGNITAGALHYLAAGDINGDGFDDIISGYPYSEKGAATGLYHGAAFIVFGNQDPPGIADLDAMRPPDVMKIIYEKTGNKFGSDFEYADINGDGYGDAMIKTDEDNFVILYGRDEFPDSVIYNQEFALGTEVTGGMFAGCGDVNGDGYPDIAGNTNSGIFILFGRGEVHNTGVAVGGALPESGKSSYNYSFNCGNIFSFGFVRSHPYQGTEFYVTNFGGMLPDSLSHIQPGNAVIAYFRAQLLNIPSSYRAHCSISYTDSMVRALGIEEPDLGVSFWNEDNGKWEPVESEVDTLRNAVSFYTEHFSTWALADKNDPVIAGVSEFEGSVPLDFGLKQNYPNPFNPATTISYSLSRASNVTLTIYSILGQEIKVLIREQKPSGIYEVLWDGMNSANKPVSSGIYIYRLSTDNGFSETRKMVLLK